jgi:hypothetical protein
MGQLVEVLSVAVEETAMNSPLLGASIDSPAAGRMIAAGAVEIDGWVLGSGRAATEVQLTVDGETLARAPVRQPRPDIAEAFPELEAAAVSGFGLVLDAGGLAPEAEAQVSARIGEQAVPIGTVRLRRRWRDGSPPGGPALVSVVIVPGSAGEDGIGATRASLAVQEGAPPLEPVIAEHEAEDGVAGRNEAIRHSNGEHLLFVEAGKKLIPDAIRQGLAALERHPESAALIDGIEGGEVAAALYRRSAFEELEGFAAGSSPDEELAGRASAYDALFGPGTLVARHGA